MKRCSFFLKGNMSFGDSKTVFEQRSKAIGLEGAVVTAFKENALDTMAKFAFCCNHSPGDSDDEPFRNLLTKVLGQEPTLVEEAFLRRLYNESYATVAADRREQTEQTSDEVHRKLAPADSAARLEEQQTRLSGITIRGFYEPGDTLVGRFANFCENDRLEWVPWDMCVSREHELLGSAKRDQRLVVQSSGELKLTSSSKVEPCDSSSKILLRYCLMRRGLAMKQANIAAYKNHDKWLEKIPTCRLGTVPAGYSRTTFQQIEAADKKLGGIRRSKIKDVTRVSHLCAVRGCFKQHPATECPGRKKD